MTQTFLKLALWCFNTSMDDLAGIPTKEALDKEKTIVLHQLAMVDSVLWMTFGKQQEQAKYEC